MKPRVLIAPLLAGACGFLLVTISPAARAQQPAAQAQPPLDPCGGRSAQPEVPCAGDVTKMLAALPAKAPATPAKPRKVLVLGRAAGFALGRAGRGHDHRDGEEDRRVDD
jgi:hypothetical protein